MHGATTADLHADFCQKLRVLLDELPGIGDVHDRPGALMAWARDHRNRAHWEMDVVRIREIPRNLGTQAEEEVTIQIEGFLPVSFENPNSSEQWRGLLKLVRDHLRANRTLDGTVKHVSLPQVLRNERVAVTSGGSAPEVWAHHCTIELVIAHYFTYTTD